MSVSFRKTLSGLNATPPTSALRRVSPLPKVCFTLGFLILAVSFDRYAWVGCALFALVPFLIAWLGGLSVPAIFRRALVAFPFVLCAGVANLFFDRTPIKVAGGFSLSGGAVSLFVLIAKTLATVGIVLVLSATTSIQEISGACVRLRVPCILVLQIQLLFRYLLLVAEEARDLADAYFLRNPACRIVPVRDWGMLAGRLFLRSVARGNAVYRAMQCRLFNAGRPLAKSARGSFGEWSVCLPILGFFCLLRGFFA